MQSESLEPTTTTHMSEAIGKHKDNDKKRSWKQQGTKKTTTHTTTIEESAQKVRRRCAQGAPRVRAQIESMRTQSQHKSKQHTPKTRTQTKSQKMRSNQPDPGPSRHREVQHTTSFLTHGILGNQTLQFRLFSYLIIGEPIRIGVCDFPELHPFRFDS